MKKYIILTLTTLSVILIIFASGYSKVSEIEYVSAVKIEKTTAVEKLNYNGTVEYNNAIVCTSGGTGVVQSVMVNNGDYVEKGDPVLTVYQTDTELTRSDIMSYASSGNYDELTSLFDGDIAVKVYEAESSGLVSSLDVTEGSVFQKGQALFKVSPEQSFQVQINVLEKDVPRIKVGQKVSIDCKALSNILCGKVKSIGRSASQVSTSMGKETTVKVLISIDDSDPDIKSGYTAVCSITLSEKKDTLLIPYCSVKEEDNGKNYVYYVNDNKIQKRYISFGTEYSNGLEIKKGLNDGDIIVYDASSIGEADNTVVNEVRLNAQQG